MWRKKIRTLEWRLQLGRFVINRVGRHSRVAVTVRDIWGIGSKLSAQLHSMHITTARQLRDANQSMIRQRFGVVVERIGRELAGYSCLEITEVNEPNQTDHSLALFWSTDNGKTCTYKRLFFACQQRCCRITRTRHTSGCAHYLYPHQPFSRTRCAVCRQQNRLTALADFRHIGSKPARYALTRSNLQIGLFVQESGRDVVWH
jgi:hypothetical protein